jgi:intracellular septation protein A
MGVTFAKYRRRFTLDGISCEVIFRADLNGLHSELRVAGEVQATDTTPSIGPDATRNHHLCGSLANGMHFEVEAGYISWVNVGIAVRRNGVIVHESHPGRRIAYPASAAKMATDPNTDMSRYSANKVPIIVDVVLGILFFILAKLTDLSTAAIIGAVIGLALVVVQRFVKVDLLGGLALFGVIMLLISAVLAILFQDDWAIKMRGTIVGTISAVLFLGDGLLGGNRLGKGLTRYLPYTDIDPGRLATGMGVLGLVMAGLNYLVATIATTDVWLFYTTFVDFFLVMALVLLVFRFARGKLFPPRRKADLA